MDDIVRQVKGVSDGLMRKVVGSSSSPNDASPISGMNLSWHADEALRHDMMKTESSFSEYEEGDKDGTHGHEEVESSAQALGWHSDNELNSKGFPPRVIKRGNEPKSLDSGEKRGSEMKSEWIDQAANFLLTSDPLVDLVGMPPEVLYIHQSFVCLFVLPPTTPYFTHCLSLEMHLQIPSFVGVNKIFGPQLGLLPTDSCLINEDGHCMQKKLFFSYK